MKLNRQIMIASAMLLAVPSTLSGSAAAQEFPLVAGDYTNVSGIFVHDGGTLLYAKHLADHWAKDQDFAKSKGWISDYKMYLNVNPRDGEPNIYLTATFANFPSAAESEKRDKEYDAWSKKSNAQLDAEAGDRAKYRTQRGSMVLQEFKVRK